MTSLFLSSAAPAPRFLGRSAYSPAMQARTGAVRKSNGSLGALGVHPLLANLPLDFGHELVIDNFAGAGGASEGIERAIRRPVDIAINHSKRALSAHAINHPYTLHIAESVWDVDPIVLTQNRPVGLVWLSPDCRHFSKAKGGTPVAKEIRGLAWVTLRWALKCRPRNIMLENVTEFQTWGPLIEVRPGCFMPDPALRGETFDAFVQMLSVGIDPGHFALAEACDFLGIAIDSPEAKRLIKGLGYKIECRELRANDYGAPTIRRRFFMVARCDGLPIVWPEASHGGEGLPAKLPAAVCIDFDRPAFSVFDPMRPRQLVPNTLRRIAKGLFKHVLATETPYIVPASGRDDGQPEGAQAAVMTPLRGTSEAHMIGRSLHESAPTVAASGTHHGLVGASLITIGYGERAGQEPRAQDLRNPLGTVVAANKHAIAAAHLTHLTHHGDRSGYSLHEQVRTVTGANRGEQALVTAFLEQAYGGFYEGHGRSLEDSMSTITGSGSQQRLVTAYLVKYYSEGGQDQPLTDSMHTLPTKSRMGLVQVTNIPLDSISPDHRERARACANLLREYLPEEFPGDAEYVVTYLRGQWWLLADLTMRMLVPRELYRAQSFPESYIIDEIPDPKLLFMNGVQVDGDPRLLSRVPLTNTDQVKMCGNSVCPLVAEALVAANFQHEHLIPGRLTA
ncbi:MULTISPECIES: DNA methyltransferase [Achromobacter]|uniref:DNA methyltransferase n=1 Tax=Achromobacter TaxID=222 RepID=UPI0023F924D3|nr:DNA methyltransferase [Achromobacter anxifer]MDF8363343.1 DNA methyltransferase [Achromobacter anxifer]